ncbi:MAG TPA: hypothetical protein VHC69_11710 [Polyangiaceae bacterium]|nr:hypothetical protein [Polyangiaceae bacterium]
MSAALIVVWLGTAASQRAHQPDLDGWAVSRERRIAPPPVEPPLPPAGHDDTAAERVEALLAEARTQAYSGDTAAAEAALDAADALLKRSAELPESAWLAGEILHERAMVAAPRDAAVAASFERRSVALVGPRAPAFAATTKEGKPAKSGPASPLAVEVPAPPAEATAVAGLTGPMPNDSVEVDGVEVVSPRTVVHGAHHVRVLRAGRLAWAGWIDVAGDSVTIAVPKPTPCSTADLPATGAGAGANASVLCEGYARARPVGPERIEVQLCHRASCGEWLPWSRTWGAAFEGPMQPPRKPHTAPPWFLWTAAGVAAVIIGGFVLAETGAFERHEPPRQTFTFVVPK